MKKVLLALIGLALLVFGLSGVSEGWQGRMGGMGDPYGLISDESDFLIHPAKIAKGEGVRFYGDYRFTYTGVLDRDWRIDGFDLAGVFQYSERQDVSGDEYRHDALVGAAFPLGPGRMGLFFTYQGMRGAYDGNDLRPPVWWRQGDLDTNFDNFALRLLYGLPLGAFKLGGEVQFAYRQEEDKNYWRDVNLAQAFENIYWQYLNTFPYDSRYWEALFKGSVEGKVGPLDLEFTLRGGFDFGGTDKWDYELQQPVGNPIGGYDLKGDVQGWRLGGDLWLRYPLATDLTLPVLVRVDYQTKTRDGDGGVWGVFAGNFDYKDEATNLAITVGGGLDKELSKGTRIAAGIYYNYLQGKQDVFWSIIGPADWANSDSTFPDSAEHQVMLRLAGEHELSPVVALRAGVNFFYGWAQWKGSQSYRNSFGSVQDDDLSADGPHWGIGASLGGTIKFKPITLEPFVQGGYQHLSLDGDGASVGSFVGSPWLLKGEFDRSEWNIGGGLSILFDL